MKRLPLFILFLLPVSVSAQMSTVTTGSGINQTVTVESAGQFRLVFDAYDNWGLSGWYDLVNDPSATTNLALAWSVQGPASPCLRESGLQQMTFYGDADKKLFMGEAGCTFPGSTRTFTIVASSPSLVIIQTSGSPMDGGGPSIDTNVTGTITYYIYPNGKIYTTVSLHVTNAQDLGSGGTAPLFFGFMGLNNPAQRPNPAPDSQNGWIRATSNTNPWNNSGTVNPNYVFAYWDSTTPTYGAFTKASILLVLGPNHPGFSFTEVRHDWNCGTGCGTVRWGYQFVGNGPNMTAGQTITERFMIQLGTQGSSVLPNLTTIATCDTIANAFRNNPVITSYYPYVNQGQTLQFVEQEADAGTWSVSGTNSTGAGVAAAGSINASTGLYTAPATVTPQQTAGGYQLFPNNHIYNVNVSAFPLRGDSAALIAGAGSVNFSLTQIEMPMNYTGASTPTESEVFYYTPANNGSYQIPAYPGIWPTAAKIQGGWLGARTNQDADHHLLTFDTTNGNLQDMYQYYNLGLNGLCLTCSSQSGVKYHFFDYTLPPITTDAAGLYISPLILRLQEMRQAIASGGTIKHALRITLQNGFLHNAFLWPGTTSANAGSGANFYGERIRLKASYDISGYSSTAQIILTAMKNYGLIISDGGTGWASTVEYTKWPAAIATALFEISAGSIGPSNFEVVDESGFTISSASGECTCNREIVTFTRTSDSATATIDPALQGVAVNFPYDLQQIQVGAPPQTFAANVNIGTVTYTMSPGGTGTLNSSTGLYSPPNSLGSITTLTITATSTVNAAVAASFTLNVFPSGTIRLIPGSVPGGSYQYQMNPTNYTDTGAKLWTSIGDWGGYSGDGGAVTGTADSKLYQYSYAAYDGGANDMRFDFIVPNGIYTITQKAASTCCSTRLVNLEADGVTVSSNFNLFTLAGGGNKAYDYVTTFTVTDNHLSWVQRTVNNLGTAIGSLQIDPINLNGTSITVKVTSGVSIK